MKAPDRKRGTITFIFIILLGYLLGMLIKNVKIGLLVGLALGLLASGIMWRRR